MAFKSLVEGERFLRAIIKSRGKPELLRKILKAARPQHLKVIIDILRNLKNLPLSGNEKAQYCQRRRAIKKLLSKSTSFKVKKSICTKKSLKGKGSQQVGGIFPIIPAIASLGISLLTSLLSK